MGLVFPKASSSIERYTSYPYTSPDPNFPDWKLETSSRLAIYGAAAVFGILILLFQRLFNGIPFCVPASYRSFAIVNKSDFVELYGPDALPKSPIEELKGVRLKLAWAQALCFGGLVLATAILLVQRALGEVEYIEESAELGYWTIVFALFAFRFYPTPYRPTLFALASLATLVPLALIFERDLLQRLLVHPSPGRLHQVRVGWSAYARVVLLLSVILLAMATPRVWYPVDPYSDDSGSPEQTCSLFSYFISYYWIENLIHVALKRDIEVEDLPIVPDYTRGKLWNIKLNRHKGSSTFWTLMSLAKYEFLFVIFCSILIGGLKFIWPFSMRKLLEYMEHSSEPQVTPWVYVLGMFFGPLLGGIAWEAYGFESNRLAIRVKAALTQSLLEKTLKIRFVSDSAKREGAESGMKKDDGSERSKVGMINNLMSTDLDQLSEARQFFLLFGSFPIEIVLSVVLLYDMLGWSSLVGVAMMVASMIIPGVLAKMLANIDKRVREATDARIGLMTEALNSVRTIKFFGMEKVFLSRIREKREAELWLSFKSVLYALGFHSISSVLPLINMLVSFGLYTKVMNQPLTASIAFTSISLFDILQSQFKWVAFMTRLVISAFVSLDRVDKFLVGEEELGRAGGEEEIFGPKKAPSYRNATLSWTTPGSESDNNFRLSELTVECVYGGLTVIVGPVGSGKSSFLLGLLGEMRLLEGDIFLPRKDGIAYVAQTAWLQSLTVRENILFGSPYEEKRYNAVLEACGLTDDLMTFEAGDLTEVGERGVTLSGGQKVRLSLARAVYSPAQTVLFDDVLSALDAGTSKLVFERCISGEVLAGRTVVLVTHQVSLVAPAAKKIIALAGGRVVSDSPPEALPGGAIEIQKKNGTSDLGQSKSNDMAPAGQVEATEPPRDRNAGKLVAEEGRASGRVPKILVWQYLRYYGPPVVIFGLVVLGVLDQLIEMGDTFFIGVWSDRYSGPGEVDVSWWLGMYTILLLGTLIYDTFCYGIWYLFSWVASRKLHEELVHAVLYSPIRFFDVTPLGRITNRLSKDVASLDDSLGEYMLVVFDQLLDIFFRAIIMVSLIPAFMLPALLVSAIGFTCGELYVRAQVGVKRIVSIKESPLFSHFGDTITGVVTIRAFSCQDRFREENLKLIDDYTQPNEANYSLNRWVGIRSSACTAIIGAAAGAIAISTTKYSPGLVGFSMSNALAFSSSILYAVRYFNVVEVELNSFERVKEYIDLPQEASPGAQREPPAAWPTQGDVKVVDLSVKYSVDGPEVLNKVSFEIKGNERIGVVGRTGAGKSSLALSLLRFTEISNGSVTINGLNIQDVNLEALRQRITIIPQDPVLFSGTIRTNLDPFGGIDDSELQAALDGSGLAGDKIDEVITDTSSMSTSGTATPTGIGALQMKRLGLDTKITTGGENLSQGQRQLLAFARALVRRSKLVIFDEATSSTDLKTDGRIQETIRSSFSDSTLITIAHRLRTVMPFDRIIVLDNLGNGGEIVEIDTPLNLLQKTGGVFYDLARKSGEFGELLELAKKGSLVGPGG